MGHSQSLLVRGVAALFGELFQIECQISLCTNHSLFNVWAPDIYLVAFRSLNYVLGHEHDTHSLCLFKNSKTNSFQRSQKCKWSFAWGLPR